MAVNESFKCWFSNMVETAQCGTMFETFDISNDDCTTQGGMVIPDDDDNAGTASSWYLAGFCSYTQYYYFCQNNPNDSACTGAPPPVTLGCPSGYHDDPVEYEILYGTCTDSLCCVPDQTAEDLYGDETSFYVGSIVESQYGMPQEAESYGGQLEQGLIKPRWRKAGLSELAAPGPILMRVLMENHSDRVKYDSSSISWPDTYDLATYLYGLTWFYDDPYGNVVVFELPDPFIITDWTTLGNTNTLTYDDHGSYMNIELNYLADVLGYDRAASNPADLETEFDNKIQDLTLLIGTSEIANQVFNSVIDYGKIRASQITTISKQEAGQTISILPGNTSGY